MTRQHLSGHGSALAVDLLLLHRSLMTWPGKRCSKIFSISVAWSSPTNDTTPKLFSILRLLRRRNEESGDVMGLHFVHLVVRLRILDVILEDTLV